MVERVVAWATALDGGADLTEARAAFERATGGFADVDPWYEERIRAFLDWYVCEWRAARGETTVARWIRQAEASPAELEAARALVRPARGLYAVAEGEEGAELRVEDRIGGARFRVASDSAAGRLRPGDLFDGRLVLAGETVRVLAGAVFHPRDAYEAIDALLAEATRRDTRTVELLDPMLRMRMRLDRFTSIRAKHIYTFAAVAEMDVLAAPWAR